MLAIIHSHFRLLFYRDFQAYIITTVRFAQFIEKTAFDLHTMYIFGFFQYFNGIFTVQSSFNTKTISKTVCYLLISM